MYQHILAVVERHASAPAAVQHAVALAARHRADLLFVHTLPRYVLPVADVGAESLADLERFEAEVRGSADHLLASAREAAAAAGVAASVQTLSLADPAAAIVELARQHRCDLIVVASRGQSSVMRMVSGSVIPRLITLSPVTVMVCPNTPGGAAAEATAAPWGRG